MGGCVQPRAHVLQTSDTRVSTSDDEVFFYSSEKTVLKTPDLDFHLQFHNSAVTLGFQGNFKFQSPKKYKGSALNEGLCCILITRTSTIVEDLPNCCSSLPMNPTYAYSPSQHPLNKLPT